MKCLELFGIILLLVVEARTFALASNTTLKRVCYYVNDGHLTPTQLDSSLCTHIIFGFASVVNGTIVPAKQEDVAVYQQLMKMKTQAPGLKIMVSIGGGSGAGRLPDISRDKQKRQLFIKQALQFLAQHGFDGLDFDWEFPGFNGDPREDVQHFSDLLTEFKIAIDALEPPKKIPLLTAAVSASLTIIGSCYNVPEMAKSLDFVNIMCYDYFMYKKLFPFTEHNSALFKHHDDVIILNTMNINWTAHFWNEEGMPKSKIVLGIPTYGHTYKLLSANKNQLRSPAVGPGSGDGWITLPEVCDMLKSGGTRVFDKESLVPYAYKDLNWASYDDEESFTFKAKWIVQGGYAGAMTWNLNSDDWNATCQSGVAFPLHQVIRKVFTGR